MNGDRMRNLMILALTCFCAAAAQAQPVDVAEIAEHVALYVRSSDECKLRVAPELARVNDLLKSADAADVKRGVKRGVLMFDSMLAREGRSKTCDGARIARPQADETLMRAARLLESQPTSYAALNGRSKAQDYHDASREQRLRWALLAADLAEPNATPLRLAFLGTEIMQCIDASVTDDKDKRGRDPGAAMMRSGDLAAVTTMCAAALRYRR